MADGIFACVMDVLTKFDELTTQACIGLFADSYVMMI